MSALRVAIVGGGIVGLSSAYGAVDAGHQVTVFDSAVGSGATHAAAGMLSPGAEFLGGFQPDYLEAAKAFSMWPDFAREIHAELYLCDTHIVGWTTGDRQDIARYALIAREHGVDVTDSGDLSIPISPRVGISHVFQEEGFVDVDEVVDRLTSWLRSRNALIRGEHVAALSASDSDVTLLSQSGAHVFDVVIVASGASHSLFSGTASRAVQSVRGVTLRVQLDAGRPAMLRGFVDGQSVYVVRRPSGVTVIGATADGRNEAVVEARDVHDLLDLAAKLVPGVLDGRFIEARAGLRPLTSDGKAFFDVVQPRVAWTSGYFRHGVLMAPLAAERAKEFVEDALHL